MARWVNAGVLLVVGAFVGGLAGASFGDEKSGATQAIGAGIVLLVILEFWIALSISLWTIVAAIDIGRLGRKRKESYVLWAKARPKKVRHLDSKAEVVAGGSGLPSVAVTGLALAASVILLGQAGVGLLSGVG